MTIKKLLVPVMLLVGLGGIATGIALWWLENLMSSPLPVESEQLIAVEMGDSKTTVLNELVSRGLIDSNLPGRIYVRLFRQGQSVKRGTYAIEQGDSLLSVLDRLYQGDEKQFSISLIEGHSLKQWLDALSEQALLRGNERDRLQVIADDMAKNLPGAILEGWLMPDTYFFTAGTDAQGILLRAFDSMNDYLEQAWQNRQFDLPYATKHDALVMASIIEKETGLASERPEIAGVFVNRLRLNMRLQTDPTVIYGLGERFDGNLTRAHLREKTAYNTYRINGLPPTPIAMPGREAIDAALHPLDTEALYFVSRGDGSHHFSSTLDEHNRAVRKYQLKQ